MHVYTASQGEDKRRLEKPATLSGSEARETHRHSPIGWLEGLSHSVDETRMLATVETALTNRTRLLGRGIHV